MTTTARLCPACCCDQPMKRFRNKTVTLTYEGEAVDLKGLSGWECLDCGELDFDRTSRAAYAQAGDELVERSREKIGTKTTGVIVKMARKAAFIGAFERKGLAHALPRNPSGSAASVVLSRCAPIDRPVDVVRALVWNGARLKEAHDILARLTRDESVPVHFSAAEPADDLSKRFLVLGVSVR